MPIYIRLYHTYMYIYTYVHLYISIYLQIDTYVFILYVYSCSFITQIPVNMYIHISIYHPCHSRCLLYFVSSLVYELLYLISVAYVSPIHKRTNLHNCRYRCFALQQLCQAYMAASDVLNWFFRHWLIPD